MSTPNRIQINQANAKHSTGPKTKAGKHRSSLNALRHGLTGQLVVMPTEDLVSNHRGYNPVPSGRGFGHRCGTNDITATGQQT
jgi:hypothetical protein